MQKCQSKMSKCLKVKCPSEFDPHVVAVSAAHCRTTALCHEQCPDTPAFVCGSDNRFYKNECIMKKENC
ncbi:Follistatin, partial [Operophtera brumata]